MGLLSILEKLGDIMLDQLEYNMACRAESVLDCIEHEESKEGKIEVLVRQFRNNQKIVSIHREVIKSLVEKLGLPAYDQAIDILLYEEQEKGKRPT